MLFLVLVLSLLSLIACASRLWYAYARRVRLVDGPVRWVERRWVWIPCAVWGALFAGCAAWAALVEPQWVQVTRTELRVARPLAGRDRLRIVHLSDLHLEELGTRERAVLAAVRGEQPDLILLTGDYMNRRGAQNDLVTFLRELKAPLGVYGVGGNWDGKWPIAELFASAGATYLRDDYRLVGGNVLLLGQDYHPTKTLAELLEGASEGSFRIFLQHSPESVTQLAQGRVDLFLCGHTHGGQVRLPFYGGLVATSRYEQGRFDVRPPLSAHPDGTVMYVNRGIGMIALAPRVRFLARPEVAVIELVAR